MYEENCTIVVQVRRITTFRNRQTYDVYPLDRKGRELRKKDGRGDVKEEQTRPDVLRVMGRMLFELDALQRSS